MTDARSHRRDALRVLVIGPGATPPGGLPPDVVDDLQRVSRPGVEVSYRFAGGGPSAVHGDDDARAAAPFVIAAAVHAVSEGFDAIVIDCTDDPGVTEARAQVDVPVIGAGEALRQAVDSTDRPVVVWSGDALREIGPDALAARLAPGVVVALGGTGWSHLTERLEAAGHRVLDPLPAAIDWCVARVQPR